MRLRLLQLKNWQKQRLIKRHPMVYLQHHFVILMHLIITLLQTTAQKVRHIGSGCSLHKQWGLADPTTQYPWKYTFPIAFTSTSYAVSLLRVTGGGCFSLKLQEKLAYAFTWTDYGTDGNAGSGDHLSVIVVGF